MAGKWKPGDTYERDYSFGSQTFEVPPYPDPTTKCGGKTDQHFKTPENVRFNTTDKTWQCFVCRRAQREWERQGTCRTRHGRHYCGDFKKDHKGLHHCDMVHADGPCREEW